MMQFIMVHSLGHPTKFQLPCAVFKGLVGLVLVIFWAIILYNIPRKKKEYLIYNSLLFFEITFYEIGIQNNILYLPIAYELEK